MLKDDLLVQRCLDGDKDAFGVLVDRYKDAVRGLAYSKVHSFHDAQDIAQEAFIDAYKNLRSLRYPHRFSSWIYAIVSNRCRMWMRKRPRESLTFANMDEHASKARLQNWAFQQNHKEKVFDRVMDAINELPETSRLVMTLYYIDGLTCKEIAEFTGTSINTIMSKLRRARAKLKEEFTEMPAQTLTQQRVRSGFTAGILRAIEHLSPAPQPSSNPIGRLTRIPWAIGLIIGLIIMGVAHTNRPGSLYGARGDEELTGVYSVSLKGLSAPSIYRDRESKPLRTPPATTENAAYIVAEEAEAASNDDEGGGFRCRVSPGDLLTYKIHKEVLDGDRLSYGVEGVRMLLVGEIEQDGVIQIVNMTHEMSFAPGNWADSEAGIGEMYVGQNGRDKWKPDSSLPVIAGNSLLPRAGAESLYFVPFPTEPLKQGDTWEYDQGRGLPVSKYTVTEFDKVKGYDCVIIDREEVIPDLLEVKSRIACDTQSGMIVKLEAESKTHKHAESGEKTPSYSIERVTVELTQRDKMLQGALTKEKQALRQIEAALAQYDHTDELDALRQKLEQVKKQYPGTWLMTGLDGMIEDVDRRIAARAEDAEK